MNRLEKIEDFICSFDPYAASETQLVRALHAAQKLGISQAPTPLGEAGLRAELIRVQGIIDPHAWD